SPPVHELETKAAVQFKDNTVHEPISIKALDRIRNLIDRAQTSDRRSPGVLVQDLWRQGASSRADVDESRCNRVHPDTERPQFLCQRPGEPLHPRFRSTIG